MVPQKGDPDFLKENAQPTTTKGVFFQVPQTIITAKIRPGVILNTYAIIINQTEVVEAYSEEAQLYNFEHRPYLFGIVTSADFSKVSSW